ncbi:PREDICTED: uncharacterized protein LOC104591575 [Nelumbo nucifera]|uniref:Uncharacterized protein LOC104591575 n=1 Tax=Nelumbo nucifera TaxID=4432 RepID=A0A1U7ZC36_NELNU|nr:PREDICTED: uncharacterized protein LOC104591575 [Nelumbo nucifera]
MLNMVGFQPMKMKRKDFEEAYDEFSDFSLSSPARKIRRLDADLPPIMGEEEALKISLDFEQQPLSEHLDTSKQQSGAVMKEAVLSAHLNEEKALVLYNPANTPLLKVPSSSDLSITVNSDLILSLKNHMLWSTHTKPVRTADDVAASSDKNRAVANDSLAVVSWVPSQLPPYDAGMTEVPAAEALEPMEAELNGMMMETEGEIPGQARRAGAMVGVELQALQQWQQEHCMIPELPQNTSAPVMWSW